ncbi:conserved hypothetical protein [groundwater metagenome]|uniref:Tc1-like transposase DDE domain-containing protein n=1 Tax=groundwater metagenome TaxID=717931 RepID=A0A098E856_9ZZZZ
MRNGEKFQRVQISNEEYNELVVVEKKIKSAKALKRVQAFKLMYAGWKYGKIADFLSVTNNTLSNWIKIYNDCGVSALLMFQYKGGQSKLNKKQLSELKKETGKGSFAYAKAAKKYIEDKYNITYHLNHVQKILKKKLRLSFKKTRKVSSKTPSVEVQKEFIEKIETLLGLEDSVVLFFDPCHLQHNVVNARMWQLKGAKGTINVNANTGRKRVNILGALNLNELSVIPFFTEESCNSARVVEFFLKAREIYPDKTITIILDNANYNHAEYTTIFAEWYNIELFFLPPYSPNLNLIERLWKFMKKILVHNKYYETFNEFKEAVANLFDNLNDYQDELKNLLTKKFQILRAG